MREIVFRMFKRYADARWITSMCALNAYHRLVHICKMTIWAGAVVRLSFSLSGIDYLYLGESVNNHKLANNAQKCLSSKTKL